MPNQSRTVLKNASAMLVSQVVTWTLTLIFAIVMRRILGPEGSGHLTLANSVWMIASVFIGFGMDMMLTKEIARDHNRAADLLGTSYMIRISLFLVGCLGMLAYCYAMGFDRETILVVQVVGLATLFMQLASASKAAHQGLETMEYISVADIASKIVNTALGVSVLLLGFRELAVAVVLVIANLVLFGIQAYFLRKHHRLRPRYRRSQVMWMFRTSLPYMATVFGIVAYSELSVISIAAHVGAEEVGWYGAANQIFSTLLFAAVVYNTVTFPVMARAHRLQPESMPGVLRRNLEFILMISVPIGLGVFSIGDKLMVLLFGKEFLNSGYILQAMGFVLIFMYLNVLFGQYFNSIDRQHVWTTVVLISALAIVPMNLVMIPWSQRVFGFGALGGAISFVILEAGQFVAGWLLVPRGTLTWRSALYALQVLLAGVLMVACVWLVRDMFIAVPVIVGALAYPALALLLRVVSKDDVERIRQMGQGLFARLRRARTEPA